MEEPLVGLAINTEAVETAASQRDHVSPSASEDVSNELEMECHSGENRTTAADVNSGSPSTSEESSNGAIGVDMSVSVREEDIDPFTYRPQFTKWDYIKITFNALWLLPLRLFFVVIPSVIVGTLTCLLAIVCDRYDEDDLRPLNRWGRFIMTRLGSLVTRVFLFGFGFNWIHIRGKLASTEEAPILIVSPHSSLLDVFVILFSSKCPTYLARSGIKHIPLFGTLIKRTLRTIFVEREDPNSRMKAVEEIRRRAHSGGEWPKVQLFPEGTTTNTKALISFKQGAFLPKLPVQPVLIKYKNKLNTTTWGEDGLGLIGGLFLTLCQFHNSLEIEFLPVYQPSEEEMENSKLFARNVQVHMAKAFGVPHTNHAFEDVLLMRTARKAGLPFRSGMVVYHKANRDLRIDLKTMKKWIRRFVAMDGDKDGYVSEEDLANFLQMPNDAPLKTVFRGAELTDDGKLSYRNYLYGIIGKAKPLIEDASFMQSLFNFFDSDNDGVISEADLSNRLPFRHFPRIEDQSVNSQEHHSNERVDQSDPQAQSCTGDDETASNITEMKFEQFTSHLATHPEYVLLFREYLKMTTTTSSPQTINDMTHSQMPSPENNDAGSGRSLVNNHLTQQQGAAGDDGDWGTQTRSGVAEQL